jgi:hypothetical protein
MRAGQYSITPRDRIRGQPARRSLPEFQTTGRSREDDDEDESEATGERGVIIFHLPSPREEAYRGEFL